MARYGTPVSSSEEQSMHFVEDYVGRMCALDLYALNQEYTIESKSPWFDLRQWVQESLGIVATKDDLSTCMKELIKEQYPPEEFNT